MDILYQKRRATATEVMEALVDPPTNATTRTLLRILETKGHIRHEKDGARFVYLPTLHPEKATKSAIRHLIQTFFDGSAARAVTALLDSSDLRLSAEEAVRLRKRIKENREGAQE
jgi:BlaI family transcriptional regulator, penicillinase repressor